jgi:nucleoside transporter
MAMDQRVLRWRLSLLMFLQYAAPGACWPLFSRHLQQLQFGEMEIGSACATSALGAILAPLVAGQIADRWFPAQRCVACCAFLAAILLCLLAELTRPAAVFWTSLAFWMVTVPTLTLGTALSFTHLASPERDFGRVRLWGTIGWVVPGWLLGYWFSDPEWLAFLNEWFRPDSPQSEMSDLFRLAAVLEFLLAAYACTLPHTPPRRHAGSWLAPLGALHLLRRPSFAIYCATSLGLCVTIPFGSQVTPLLLAHLGISPAWLPPTLTISQSMEVATLALLPVLLLRLGLRGTMFLGLAAWTLTQAILTLGQPVWLVVAALGGTGVCVCCFQVAGQLFVNSRARGDIRASAQGLLTFVNGLGLLAGNLLAGWVRKQAGGEFPPTFAVGAAITCILAMFFLLAFNDEERSGAVDQKGV